MIVAICGLDASGKASQTKILAERMNAVRVAFPDYETPAGKAILSLLKQEWGCRVPGSRDAITNEEYQHEDYLGALVLQSLMTTNRLELLPTINEHIKAGRHLVFDRYFASGIVYGTLDGLEREWIERIQAPLPSPDVWILLDIPPEESVKRRPERRDRYESTPGFQEKVRDGYLKLFEEKRTTVGLQAWRTVDGMGTVEEVAQRIWNIVSPRLLLKPARKVKREVITDGLARRCSTEGCDKIAHFKLYEGEVSCFNHLSE